MDIKVMPKMLSKMSAAKMENEVKKRGSLNSPLDIEKRLLRVLKNKLARGGNHVV